ncbi:AraC family transcriptional regulator [Paenibacillus sp. LHD-117]|uniref:AraC family transcriptional regulator n=1 Tax=Paenibacillus sp. LHD-117 TaxID=3071412 RepID=UPI0027E03C68|nr:AraC family transcriptional regulator [Paenibacillus sp. LHD-117]MDQ6421215.1 AraC family transcriptional regulator [Paenibacillus sp. LHD-117]
MLNLGFIMPSLIQHKFWKAKEQFLLQVDTYEDWVIFLVERGSFRYTVGEFGGVASGGDWILCAPGTPFRREVLSRVDFHFLSFTFLPKPGEEPPAPLPAGHYRPEESERSRDTLRQLRADILAANADPGYAQALKKHLLNDLWLHLFASVREASTGLPRQTEDPLMRSAAERIRMEAGSPFVIKQLASELGLTPVQFTRRFKAAYQLNPLQFATEIRLHTARKLLAETDFTLDAIAWRCGYENGFYLSRKFKKQTQTTPSEYRKESLRVRPILL